MEGSLCLGESAGSAPSVAERKLSVSRMVHPPQRRCFFLSWNEFQFCWLAQLVEEQWTSQGWASGLSLADFWVRFARVHGGFEPPSGFVRAGKPNQPLAQLWELWGHRETPRSHSHPGWVRSVPSWCPSPRAGLPCSRAVLCQCSALIRAPDSQSLQGEQGSGLWHVLILSAFLSAPAISWSIFKFAYFSNLPPSPLCSGTAIRRFSSPFLTFPYANWVSIKML